MPTAHRARRRGRRRALPGIRERPGQRAGRRRAARGGAARRRSRASACSTPARRPAARPATCSSARPDLAELIALDISRARLARVARNLERLGLQARAASRATCSIRWLVGRPALRPHPARCALFGDRRDPPPSGHQAAAPARGHRRLRAPRSARCWTLRPRCSRRAAGCSTPPARSCRPRTSRWWSGFLGENPACSARSRRTCCCCRRPRRLGPRALTDGFYYACLHKGGAGSPVGNPAGSS